MKASTNGKRLLILCDDTILVPTHAPIEITLAESTDEFTKLLVQKGEVTLHGVVEHEEHEEHVEHVEHEEHEEQPDTLEQELQDKLNAMTKAELVALLASVGIEEKERTSKEELIAKVIEYEQTR